MPPQQQVAENRQQQGWLQWYHLHNSISMAFLLQVFDHLRLVWSGSTETHPSNVRGLAWQALSQASQDALFEAGRDVFYYQEFTKEASIMY